MEAVETTNNNRKKTPPSIDKKKQMIRELGRKPSDERVSLYVRRSSVADNPGSDVTDDVKLRENSRARQFMDSMEARKSMEIPNDFLKTIEEENKKSGKPQKLAEEKPPKKFPFFRTTTPNSLREHLKETLVKNISGNNTELAETIQSFKDDEILDTFNIDSENIETPPIQRRRQPEADTVSLMSDSEHRKNRRFRNADGKTLGDRELALKKKKASNLDLSQEDNLDEDELGIFERFSNARKTLTRSSVRSPNKDADTLSLNDANLEKSQKGDWRSRLASKFKKSSVDYDMSDPTRKTSAVSELTSYRRTSDEFTAPMTEPIRRKNTDITAKRGSRTPRTNRKTSFGDYNSELVDGKYVTSVPIINVENPDGESMDNIRPGRGLKDLKKPLTRKNSLIERLARSNSSPRTTENSNSARGSRPAASTSNVFDRLNGSSNLRGSRRSLNVEMSSAKKTPSSSGALTKIKDLTKTLRKSSKEEDASSVKKVNGAITPRNSHTLFDRKPMSNLNKLDSPRSSRASSTRSLSKQENFKKNVSPKVIRKSIATLGNMNKLDNHW